MTSKRLLATAVSILATLLLTAASYTAPAFAGPTTTFWSGERPAPTASIAFDPRAVSLNAVSSGALSPGDARMTIDGVAYKTLVTNPTAVSGHWKYVEMWDDDAEVWTMGWTWIPDPDVTKATLLTYAWGGPLGRDGDHTVVASIKDANGDVTSTSWTFSVKIPPKVGSPSPADRSTVDTTSPTISVPVSDNGTVASWDVTVNGSDASATLSGGVLHIAPASPLINDATTTVALTIRDAVGASSSLTWSFGVQIYSQMADMRAECLSCHPGRDASPDMTPECGQCHGSDVRGFPHPGDPAVLHVRADTACAPCHVRSLPIEHARRTDAEGKQLTCMTCHRSSDQAVVSAIASRNSNCATCHDDAATVHSSVGNPAKHTLAGVNAACLASGCHATTGVAQLHSNATTSVAGEVRRSCAVCHTGGVPSSTECSTCHPEKLDGGVVAEHAVDPSRHVGSDVAAQQATDTGYGCTDQPDRGVGCHNISNLPKLHAGAPGGPCAPCHGAGKTPSNDCRSCHPRGSDLPTATTLAGTTWYHHNNVKYLRDASDATSSPYYYGDANPPHGWNDALYYQECYANCHRDTAGSPPVFVVHEGQRMWYSLGADWSGTSTRTLTLAPLTLSGPATLSFTTAYSLDPGDWGPDYVDNGYIEASTDGTSWAPLTGTVDGTSTAALTGVSAGWVSASYDLSAYSGVPVQVRFKYVGSGYSGAGWGIDTISITDSTGTRFSDDAESVNPLWTSDGWIRASEAYAIW